MDIIPNKEDCPCATSLGVRILCSKIRELCYALMLTIYANYAPQISHYTIMLLSKIIFLDHKNTFSHRTVAKHIERLQNSRIEAKCHWLVTLVVLQHKRCLNIVLERTILTLQLGSLCLAIFSHRVTWKLHIRNTHGLQNNQIMPA